MRIVLTTVLNASVTIDNKIVGKINRGFCLLVGFTHEDTIDIVHKMARKIAMLRVFDDEAGKMNKAIKDGIDTVVGPLFYAETKAIADIATKNNIANTKIINRNFLLL